MSNLLDSIACAITSSPSRGCETSTASASCFKQSSASCIEFVIELHIDSNIEVAKQTKKRLKFMFFDVLETFSPYSTLCLGCTVILSPCTSIFVGSRRNDVHGTVNFSLPMYPLTNSSGRFCLFASSLSACKKTFCIYVMRVIIGHNSSTKCYDRSTIITQEKVNKNKT